MDLKAARALLEAHVEESGVPWMSAAVTYGSIGPGAVIIVAATPLQIISAEPTKISARVLSRESWAAAGEAARQGQAGARNLLDFGETEPRVAFLIHDKKPWAARFAKEAVVIQRLARFPTKKAEQTAGVLVPDRMFPATGGAILGAVELRNGQVITVDCLALAAGQVTIGKDRKGLWRALKQ